jgi:DNA-binding response OmpR family regulator
MALTVPPAPLALIVEDDDKLIDIFSQALTLAGFSIKSSMDGQDAIDLLKSIRPTIVLLDLHLPGAPGEKVLSAIRQDEHLKGVQVILATADPSIADMLEDRSDYILQKPISFGQLRDLAIRIRSSLS